jgi:hypothetical protein
VTKEPDQKIDPGFVIRARLRRSVLYVELGRSRNPNSLTQSRQIAKRQLERTVELRHSRTSAKVNRGPRTSAHNVGATRAPR